MRFFPCIHHFRLELSPLGAMFLFYMSFEGKNTWILYFFRKINIFYGRIRLLRCWLLCKYVVVMSSNHIHRFEQFYVDNIIVWSESAGVHVFVCSYWNKWSRRRFNINIWTSRGFGQSLGRSQFDYLNQFHWINHQCKRCHTKYSKFNGDNEYLAEINSSDGPCWFYALNVHCTQFVQTILMIDITSKCRVTLNIH